MLADIGVPMGEVVPGLLAVRERFSALFAAGGETAETDPDRRDAECLEQRAAPARLLDQFVEIHRRPPCMRRQADSIGAAWKGDFCAEARIFETFMRCEDTRRKCGPVRQSGRAWG